MYYILHGEEEFGRAAELARIRDEEVGDDAALGELNTSILDGERLTFSELRHACDVVPFMAGKRVVIVQGLLARLVRSRKGRTQEAAPEDEPSWKRAFLNDLMAYLPALPSTTALVFVETKLLQPSHPILKLARKETGEQRPKVKVFAIPRERALPGWIRQWSRAKGVTFSREAANRLAALVGPDLRLLDQEIEKLLLYAGERQVTAHDVQLLVSRARQESIFELVDCLGQRQSDRALTLLHRLLDDGESPLYVLAMIARQVRLLMQVIELREQGLAQHQMASRLSVHPYVIQKVLAQSPRFRMAQLEAAHERLLEADWAIKTGEIEDELALDMLVVALTTSEQPRS